MNLGRWTVVLVGGGRWGRVHASNLSQLLTPCDRVLWVSRHNQGGLRDVVRKLTSGPQFVLLTNLEDALLARPEAALVATAPDTHVTLADACLRRGIHTFVEKPLAFKASDARSLIDVATSGDLILAAGLHLLSASYLNHFKGQLSAREITRIYIRWFDAVHEVRYGEVKRADVATPVVHDLYPHIWSIVRVLTGCDEQKANIVSARADGSYWIETSADSVKVEAQCDRYAGRRERKIHLVFRDGGSADFDFTQEPGEGRIDNAPLSSDPAWGKTPRPVMAEVREFLEQVFSPPRNMKWPHLAVNCIDSVFGAEVLNSQME
jgi:predicted dehydrogenase